MADVFISYAREDRSRVALLASALEGAGLTVWWDRNISGGAEFSMMIETELEAASHVIVAWSSAALTSHWVRDEADMARQEEKLIPITLDGSLPPLGFRQLHALDFETWQGEASDNGFQELLKVLGPSTDKSAREPSRQKVFVKPGIAVLPFDNMSSDQEIEHLADGLTEDIISSLATIRHLTVPARNSTFVYKGKSVDLREVGEALGVRYVVEGSVRKLGPTLRITAQFIEATTGNHLWANKFDITLEDFYAKPDDVVERICGTIFSLLIWVESDYSEKLPESEQGPWEYCQQAAAFIGKGGGTVEKYNQAMAGLEKALSIEPDYALAHAMLAWGKIAGYVNGIYEDGEGDQLIASFLEHLEIARQTADSDLLVMTYIGSAEQYSGQHEGSIQTLESVLRRNPSLGVAWFGISLSYAYLGRFEEANAALDRADEVAPEGGYAQTHSWYRVILIYLSGDYEKAAPMAERAVLQQREYGYSNIVAAFCLHKIGQDSKARRYIAQAKQYNPQLTPEKLQPMILAQPDPARGAEEYALLVDWWG